MKTPVRKNFPLFHVRDVQRNAKFYSRIYNRQHSQFSRANFSGSYGPGGTYSEPVQGGILKFGQDSKRLHTSVETFVKWLANKSPPWMAYRSFMSVCLITFDKQPEVCPVRVWETWRRLFLRLWLRPKDLNPPWFVSMISCMLDLKKEWTYNSTGFMIFGTKSWPRRIWDFCF